MLNSMVWFYLGLCFLGVFFPGIIVWNFWEVGL